jgi:tagatose 1,6-diphosphate aldolase
MNEESNRRLQLVASPAGDADTVRQRTMSDAFKFLRPGKLIDGDLTLVLVKTHPANPMKKYVPWYEFDMRKVESGVWMGRISLRVGSPRALRCPGHVGYEVNKRYRGHRYAARACGLLLPLASAHGLRALWITCDPKNKASVRTLELAGGKYIDTIRIPKNHEMYEQGGRYLRRYRIGFKKELSIHRVEATR